MSIAQVVKAQEPLKRLEKALRIALHRAHGETDPANARYAQVKIDALLDDDVRARVPMCYRAWQDAKRIINQLEGLERSRGIEHVRILRPGGYLDTLYDLPSQELKGIFQDALKQQDPCPVCGGLGRIDDIPCWKCDGRIG